MATSQSIVLAFILWLVVGGLAGAVIAEIVTDPTPGQLLFSIIAGAGLVALLIIGWQSWRRNKMSPTLVQDQPALPAPLLPTTDPKVAAREWLDDFLVQQQQKE